MSREIRRRQFDLKRVWDGVCDIQERLPTFYWLPKLHKQPYKSRFIAIFSSCTTNELSKLLASCLTTIKILLLNTVKKSMKRPVKIFFGQSKINVRL